MITFTRAAFDLLSLNYHKAVQEENESPPQPPLLLCATVIAFLIFFGEVRNTDTAARA